MGYSCDFHPGNAAVLLGTNLTTGDVTAMCPADIFDYGVSIASAMLPDGSHLEVVTDATTPAEGDPTDDDDLDAPVPYGIPDPTGGDQTDGAGPDPTPAESDPIGEPHDDPTADPADPVAQDSLAAAP